MQFSFPIIIAEFKYFSIHWCYQFQKIQAFIRVYDSVGLFLLPIFQTILQTADLPLIPYRCRRFKLQIHRVCTGSYFRTGKSSIHFFQFCHLSIHIQLQSVLHWNRSNEITLFSCGNCTTEYTVFVPLFFRKQRRGLHLLFLKQCCRKTIARDVSQVIKVPADSFKRNIFIPAFSFNI